MYQDYLDFVINYGVWMIVAGALLLVGMLVGNHYRGILRRRRLFRSRPCLTEAEWFAAFYPASPGDRESVRQILQAFADDIGVEWTRFRPSDTFEEVLRVDRRYSPYDDLEEAELRIVARAEKLGLTEKGLPGFTGVLKDFLDRWVSLRGGEPPGQPTGDAAC